MWYQFTINASEAQTTRQGCFKMRLAPVSIFRLRPIVYNVVIIQCSFELSGYQSYCVQMAKRKLSF